MKRLIVAAALLAAAGLVRADSAASGADVYAKKCAMCHGKDGKPSAVGVKMGAKDLSVSALSKDEMEKVIENGRNKMTAFKGKLSEDEIEAVAKYVKAGLK
jgi:cytochrome c6